MRAVLLALVALAACSFTPPGEGPPAGAGQGDGGTGGGSDGGSGCRDDDQDGVCNELDDWPCGLKPDDPGDAFSRSEFFEGRWWGADEIAIGEVRRVIANRDQDYAVAFDWSITLYCGSGGAPPPMCKGQLEYGYGETRAGCLFDADVPHLQARTGRAMTMLRAPTMPGVYELRLNAGKRSSCGTNSWYGGNPGQDSTIAILCVPP
jgi:hypothetical protein